MAAGQDKGIAEFNEGRYAAAVVDLRAALRAHPEDAEAKGFLALAQAGTGDCSAAEPELSASIEAAKAPVDRLAGLALAKCKSAGGKTLDALAVLGKVQARYPADADVLYLNAKLHMKAFNDATFTMFQRAPSSFRVHELSAEIFEVQSRYADAVAEYRKAIALNPAAPDLHFHLGRALLLHSHSPEATGEAAQQFRAELQVSPEDSACEYQLGQIADVQGNGAEAKTHFERAATLSPDFVQNLVALGRAYSRDKQVNRAIDVLTRATHLQPDNEAAHYALLNAYRSAGEMDKAKTEKVVLDRLQKPPEGEFSEFLKKLGDPAPQP